MSLPDFFIVALGLTIFILFFIILTPMLFFIKNRKLRNVENILDDGKAFYSLNILTAGMGILHYATVFFWGRHAKRYNLCDKRQLVPKSVQRWFIVYFCLFMVTFALCFIAVLIVHLGLG